MSYVSDWIGAPCMEWQKQLNDFMIIGELENANPPIIAKGALLMDSKKMESCPECSAMQGIIMF